MKFPELALITTLLLPAIAIAGKGGAGDAGGGYAFSSTPEEVRRYVRQSPEKTSPASDDLLRYAVFLEGAQALNPGYAPNETLKRIFLAIKTATENRSLAVILAGLKLVPKPACYDSEGQISDSSTIIGKLNAPVCINIHSLTRLPAESLKIEILALVFHEFTHQLGFGENEAIEMQNYVKHLLPLAISLTNEAGGGTPLRIGGEITLRAQDGTSVKVQCTSRERYDQTPKGGTIFKSSVTILFPGQSTIVRGFDYGDGGVGCSDLPQLVCRATKPTEDEIKYSRAKSAVEAGSARWRDSDFGLNSSDPQVLMQELRRQGVCL